MTHALVAVSHATLGGVYYCANFTTSGAQPVWTRLTTTGLPSTEPDIFRVDYGSPTTIQYLGFSCTPHTTAGTIYMRNSGNWSKIMDVTIASTVTGVEIEYLNWLWTDPYVFGTVYCIAVNYVSSLDTTNYVLESTDYGANWAVKGAPWAVQNTANYVNVRGDYIWFGYRKSLLASTRAAGSLDGGTTWGEISVAGGAATPGVTIDIGNPTRAYVVTAATGLDRLEIAAPATVSLVDTSATAEASHTPDHIFTDPDNAGYAVTCVGEDIYYTEDSYASDTETALDAGEQIHAITNFWNQPTLSDLVFGTTDIGPGARILHINSKLDGTVDNRSGANSLVPPYTDSIPEVGYVVEYGIWAGMPLATAGAYVYADEQGDITDIPDPDNLGIPMFGDRSSWRDYDVDTDGDGTTLADYHAQDIQEDTPQRHAPWSVPAPAADYGIVSDGTKWIISTDEMALVSGLHDAVTLDADAAILLDLQGVGGQEIGLDTQAANLVFAGPAAGAANEPTFRALVAADLPASVPTPDDLHQHTYQEDHTAECDGAEDNFITANQFEEDTTMVWLNGVLQRPDVDYTEDATLDAVTFTTAPENVDVLIIAYIVDLEV